MANPVQDFQACTIKFTGRANRITSAVQLTEAFDPEQFKDQTIPFQPLGSTALWDTGATKTFLTRATVSALGLKPVGTTNVNHAGGTSESSTYLINVFLPNNTAVVGVLACECENIAGDFGAILGMDIISQGDFSVTNVDGKTCMSFRIPSIKTIDYCIEADQIKFAHVRPNDPCPCGKKDETGKPIKYKFCHRRSTKQR